MIKGLKSDPAIQGGKLVLGITNVPVSTILSKLANGLSIYDIAFDMKLNPSELEVSLASLANWFDRPWAEI